MAMQDYTLSDIAAASDGNGLNGDGGVLWILLLFALFGGWNGRGYNGGNAGSVGGNELYPWMENQAQLSNGFAGVSAQFAALQAQFANCCCENRVGLANLAGTIQAEGAADRAAVSDGIRDILAAQSANTQRVLDQLCQDKIDAKNEEIANLRQQVNMMNLAASQNLQTAQLLADNAAQTAALEQYLAPTPRPAYVVQNPNCCTTVAGCGCGM